MKLPRATLKKARIEIIPMIDTIFFLLVFFMFSSLQRVSMSAPSVRLPNSTTAAGKTKKKVVVTVDRTGDYYVDKEKVDLPDILPELKKRIERDEDLVVIINADKDQEVGQIQRLIDIGKQANPAKMYIATAPDDKTTDEGDEAETNSRTDTKAPPATPVAAGTAGGGATKP